MTNEGEELPAHTKRPYKFFQRNLLSPRRRSAVPSLHNKFRTPSPGRFLRRQSKESSTVTEISSSRSESTSDAAEIQPATDTTSSRLSVRPVVDTSRLGIQPTGYDIPDEPFAYQQGGGRGIVSPEAETEVVFFTEEQSSVEDTQPLFRRNSASYNSLDLEVTPSPEKIHATTSSSPDPNSTPPTAGSINMTPAKSSPSSSAQKSKAIISAETKRKAKEIVEKARQREPDKPPMDKTSVPPLPANSPGNSVKIFLLLLEPKSKIFELIVLLYPRKNTTVGDLLRMVPKNATESVLANQVYVGITRPKRRAEPVTDLKMLASNSVHSTSITAGIVQREIILAIPAHSDTRQIVSLSKQILSNEHIRTLMAKANQPKRKSHKRDTSKGSLSTKSTRSNDSTTTPAVVSPTNVIDKDTGEVNSSFHEFCELEMKRAVAKANVANKQAGRSPFNTPKRGPKQIVVYPVADSTRSLSPSRKQSPAKEEQRQVVDFPTDMMQAYMSNNAMMMKTRGDNKRGIDHRDSIQDDISDDGSFTNSFHSWSQSVDTSCSVQAPTMTPRTRRKQVAKYMRNLKRLTLLSFLASIAIYYYDPNGFENDGIRELAILKPMGCMEFFSFLLTLISLVKFQRFVSRPICHSRCPVLQALSNRIAAEHTKKEVKMY